MKTSTFRKMTALVLSIMLVLSMCMTGISVSAAESTKTIYFAASSNWQEADARFTAYSWADGVEGTFTSMTEIKDGIYSAEISDKCTSIIFVRMNPATTDNNWDNKWNQTADLTIPADKNCFNINAGEWDGANGTWSTYEIDPTQPTTQPVSTPDDNNTLYFAPSSNWKESDPRFVMYMWGDGVEGTFTSMTKGADDVYSATLADGCTSVIFVRMNPATTENNWDNKWNQTADLVVPQYSNLFVLNQDEWDNANGTWSTYYEPTEPVTTEPVTTEPVTTEPVTTEPVTTEPVTTEPVTTQPVTTEPVETTEPTTVVVSEFTYTVLEDGTAEITGYTGNDSTVVIPSTIDGYKVTSIGSYTISSYYNDDRTALVISEGIKTIKSTAFSNWYSLKEVQLPESLETIDEEAFYYCQNLESINFPNNLVSVGNGAFAYCSKIKEVTISGGKLTLIDDWAFNRCDSIESVTLNGNNAEIGSYAFNDCVNLTSLTLNGIKTMGEQGFDCCNLESVVLPEGLETIDYSTFASNTNLKSVVVPKSLTKMQNSSFYDVADNFTMFGYTGSYAETFVNNNPMLGITFVALDAFEYEVLEDGTIEVTDYFGESETLVIPSTIDGYQVSVFNGAEFWEYDRNSCKKLIISEGVKTIAGSACHYWDLEEVYLADSVEYIYDYAFELCEELKIVKFPANLKYIGQYAFSNCDKLQNIEITGGKLSYMGMDAFFDCHSADSIIIYGDNLEIPSYSFYNCVMAKTLKLEGIKSISYETFPNLFIRELVLPEGLESIGTNAFGSCPFLKKVVIPKSVTGEIPYGAFPSGVTIYGYTGTEAEAYATRRNLTFVDLEGVVVTGDINLALKSEGSNIYSGSIDLEAGEYNFNLNEFGTVLGFKMSFADTTTISYADGYETASTLVASGGRYEFVYNASAKVLKVRFKPASEIVELFGTIDVELVRSSGTIFTGSVNITRAGRYTFKINDRGVEKGFGFEFNDVVFEAQYNENWNYSTGFNATGGVYTIKYDTATSKLTFMHAPAGLGEVRVFGDFNLDLAKQGNNLYSAQTTLEAGEYQFRVDAFGTTLCNGSKFGDTIGIVEYKTDWKAATEFTVTEKKKFTFIFNAENNTLAVYNAPIDTTKVLVAFENSNLELKSTNGVTYKGTITLTEGSHPFRIDEFGVTMCYGGDFTDTIPGYVYSDSYKSATNFTATGGTYTFTYNVNTNALTVTKG